MSWLLIRLFSLLAGRRQARQEIILENQVELLDELLFSAGKVQFGDAD